jgi:hypothetical protein
MLALMTSENISSLALNCPWNTTEEEPMQHKRFGCKINYCYSGEVSVPKGGRGDRTQCGGTIAYHFADRALGAGRYFVFSY